MTTRIPETSSHFFYDLFAPLPSSASNHQPDLVDHVANYVDTSQGAGDLFRVIENAISCLGKAIALSKETSTLLEKVSDTANIAGIGLSIPAILSDCNNLRHSVADLVAYLPYSDPLRERKIAQAVKKSFLDSMCLANDVSQAALFIDRVKIILFEAKQLRILDGIYNGSSVIVDGAELVSEYFKLKFYHSPEAQLRNLAQKLEEKKTFSWMLIAKDVSSVASGAIALYAIFYGIVLVEVAPFLATVSFGCSIFWLVMKISSCFYNKIVVEAG